MHYNVLEDKKRDFSRSNDVEFPWPVLCLKTNAHIHSFSEISFNNHLTLSGLPVGIFTDKQADLLISLRMSGSKQFQGCWLTKDCAPQSVRNTNRLRQGIQSESGLMSLIHPATFDKAPALSAASGSPQCRSLLITWDKANCAVPI